MGKKRNKPAPGQKALSSEFATTPRQKRLAFGTADEPPKREYEPFVPGPNPQLDEFVRQHATPYDPESDQYEVAAFSRDLIVDKAAPPKDIYNMHTYWSKKHWAAIRQYIRHYLPDKYYPSGTGLVVDCFSGSGMTGVAAMMENRPCVLIDASPAAAFISHCYTHPVDPDDLRVAYDRMMVEPYSDDLRKKLRKISGQEINNLQQELDWLYATTCDRCGGRATTEFVAYSERFQCPNCGEIVPLFDCPEAKVPYLVGSVKKRKTELKKRRVCPHCLKKAGGTANRDFVISTRTKRFGSVPVLVVYRCREGCSPPRSQRLHNEPKNTRKARFFTEADLPKIEQVEQASIPHWYPQRKMMDVEDDEMPWGVKWRAGTSSFRTVADLFTKRNLWALAAVKAAIVRTSRSLPFAEAWNVAFTAVSMNGSRMYRYRPSGKGGLAMGTYYMPQLAQIMRVSSQFADKRNDILQGEEALLSMLRGPVAVSNEDSSRAEIPPNSVDYLFTDPAYVDKVQYGELNFVWESWLGFEGSWLQNEIVVNPYRNKSVDDWDRDIRRALANGFQALKPGRWLSLCYHDTDPGTWTRLQNALLDTGFEIHTVTVLDPKQKSSNQIVAEKVVKSDLVVNCRKPKPGEDDRGDEGGEIRLVSQRVREILVDTLAVTGGQTRDRLWDVVLRRLLTRGQMAEHRFDHILEDIAFRSESGRWFLKEEFESLSQGDIKNEEAAGDGLARFARLRSAGVPVNFAAQIALASPRLAGNEIDEGELESHIKSKLISDKEAAKKFALGGRMKGVEFYDCLFFYLTRFLKGRAPSQSPRRNLAEFLEEYLVRFKDGDKWLYRVPDAAEAEALRKSRQTGLGRRIRQYVAFLRGEGEFPAERRPDAKTSVAWLKHCANFGLADEGVLLFEKGGMAAFLNQLSEDDRYDAEDYYAQCRRKAAKAAREDEDDQDENTDDED